MKNRHCRNKKKVTDSVDSGWIITQILHCHYTEYTMLRVTACCRLDILNKISTYAKSEEKKCETQFSTFVCAFLFVVLFFSLFFLFLIFSTPLISFNVKFFKIIVYLYTKLPLQV